MQSHIYCNFLSVKVHRNHGHTVLKFHFSRELKKAMNNTLQNYTVDRYIHNKTLILENHKLYLKSMDKVPHCLLWIGVTKGTGDLSNQKSH